MSDLDRTDELIATAAMGELSSDERIELDELAGHDPTVETELAAAMSTASMVHAAFAMTPPPDLRASVLRAVASTDQEPAWAPPEPDDESDVVDLGTERTRRRSVTILATAAALLLFVGVGSVFVFGDRGGNSGEIASVQTADDAVERRLEGDLGGSLTVVHSPGEGAIVVDGDGLPVLDENRTFVLWTVDNGDTAEAVAVGEFEPDGDGNVSVRIDDVDPAGSELAVTEETVGEVDTPTEPVLARG